MLDYPARDAGGKAAVWVQLVDIFAQESGKTSPEIRGAVIERLGEWRQHVSERRRLATAVSVAGQSLPAELVAHFASDIAPVAAPVLVRTQLSGEQWSAIIPKFPPASRALLRERRDLPEAAQAALAAFGTSDFVLPRGEGFETASAQADLGRGVPIGELVRRIEAYRERSGGLVQHPPRAMHQKDRFAFESDAAGALNWVEGVPRGPLIGTMLGTIAEPGGFGVDGQAAGAFRKRAAIRDARLSVPGHSEVAGDWLISAQPFFDAGSGRFEGYRGVARRIADVDDGPVSSFGAGMKPESVRQLVHELRTPLNAIRGFAEMIEGQFLGSVEPSYRDRANAIIHESGRLLRLFEDLDLSARIAGGEEAATPGTDTDLIRIMRTTAGHHAALADRSGVRLQIALPDKPLSVMTDDATVVRLLDRLLLCVLATGAKGETLRISLTPGPFEARIEATRPALIRGLSVATLFDAANGAPPPDDELPLGLGFVLRLMRQMARRANGRFEVGGDSFVLILPRRSDSHAESIESS